MHTDLHTLKGAEADPFAWKQSKHHLPFCFRSSEETHTSLAQLGTSLFHLNDCSEDLFLSLARLLLTFQTKRDCLLLLFVTQVIEIFIYQKGTWVVIAALFSLPVLATATYRHHPGGWGGPRPHLTHSLASDVPSRAKGKSCTGTAGIIHY